MFAHAFAHATRTIHATRIMRATRWVRFPVTIAVLLGLIATASWSASQLEHAQHAALSTETKYAPGKQEKAKPERGTPKNPAKLSASGKGDDKRTKPEKLAGDYQNLPPAPEDGIARPTTQKQTAKNAITSPPQRRASSSEMRVRTPMKTLTAR